MFLRRYTHWVKNNELVSQMLNAVTHSVFEGKSQ